MIDDADQRAAEIIHKLRKIKGFCPMTPEEADAAFDASPGAAMSRDEIQSILQFLCSREAAAKRQPAPARSWKRLSHWMRGLTVKQRMATAGAGAAVLLGFLLLWGGINTNPVSAMEQMAENIRRARSYTATMTMQIRLVQKPGEPPVTAEITGKTYWLAPKSYRMETKGNELTVGMDGTDVSPSGKAGIHIDHRSKKYVRDPAPRVGQESPLMIFDKLSTFSGQADRKLGTKEIDGKKARGFEIDGKKIDAEAYPGPVEIWLDAESNLPISLCYQMKSPAMPTPMTMRIEHFQWNINLDPKLFEAEPPPGYAEEKRSPAEWPGPEKTLQGITFALKTFAELRGQYPRITRTFAEPVRDEMYHAAGLAYPRTVEQRMYNTQYRKLSEAQNGFAVFNRVLMYDPDAAYYGGTVGPGDKDKLLLRWKLDDGRYQVIFGDLRADTITAEKLRPLEAAKGPELKSAQPTQMAVSKTLRPLGEDIRVGKITEALTIYAKVSGGHYPRVQAPQFQVTRDEVVKMLGIPWPPKTDEQRRDEKFLKLEKVLDGVAAIIVTLRGNPDAAYYGRTVGPGDKDKVLLRWKLDDGRYQVIFGDLRAATVTAEQLHDLGGK
jgi:outer membrane lipoprotein-sorting protein